MIWFSTTRGQILSQYTTICINDISPRNTFFDRQCIIKLLSDRASTILPKVFYGKKREKNAKLNKKMRNLILKFGSVLNHFNFYIMLQFLCDLLQSVFSVYGY